MSKDGKIKKIIREKTKPEVTFAEFYEKNEMRLHNDTVQGNIKVKSYSRNLSIGALVVLGCCIICAVIATILVCTTPSTSPLPTIKYYGSDMVKEERITYTELLDDNIPLLIDFSKVEQYGVIFRVTPKDEELLLGYTVRQILYGFYIGDNLYAYELTMNIRCYEGYLFTTISLFENPDNIYDDSCTYNIAENGAEAYIAISRHDYEYFITAKEYEGLTPINKTNIELLIQDIF